MGLLIHEHQRRFIPIEMNFVEENVYTYVNPFSIISQTEMMKVIEINFRRRQGFSHRCWQPGAPFTNMGWL